MRSSARLRVLALLVSIAATSIAALLWVRFSGRTEDAVRAVTPDGSVSAPYSDSRRREEEPTVARTPAPANVALRKRGRRVHHSHYRLV